MKEKKGKLTQTDTNPFPYSNSNKRYHTLNYHLNEKFGGKVFKVSLDAGFSCPNIDGKKGVGGCTYCSNEGSGDFAGDRAFSITDQFNQVRERLHKKWHEGKYISYFQAYTNTYAPTYKLRELYKEALSQDNVVALFISTRPDCVSEETIRLLKEINSITYLVVELGLQSIYDTTGERINRCHSYEDFRNCTLRLKAAGINVCAHIINGLPQETPEMMLTTAKACADLNLHSIKIHLLHILKNTKIAAEYLNGEFTLPTMEEYVNIVCNQLEILPSGMIIQRLTGDGDRNELIAPQWSLKKFNVINSIDKELMRRGSYQGKFYTHKEDA